MDAQGVALFENLEKALATVSTADKWLADPQFKSETILLIEKLNKLPDDPETKEMLKFAKEILQSVQDGLGRNDGEFMINLSGALRTVADLNGFITVIREYLTPTSVAYFGVASPIVAKILTHIIYQYIKNSNDRTSSRMKEELNILRAQLNVQFQIGRLMCGLFLIGKVQINLQREMLRKLSPDDSLHCQYENILDQIEQESKQYLDYVAPFSPVLLKITQGIQLRIEREMEEDKNLLKLNITDLLDQINCFTHGDVLLEGLYKNILTVNLTSNRSSLTWRYLSRTYEQDDKLKIVLHKFISEIKESINGLFDIITKTQIFTRFSLYQALGIIYSNENYNELHFPAIASELTKVNNYYHQTLNEEHIRDLLRKSKYTGLNEDNGMYGLLIDLLRKRAFFEVSHQLFCSLSFPNNIFTEIKIGALDVYNTFRHPVDTIINTACMPYQFLRHPIQMSRQIGAFLWNRPIRALTSTAINGALMGGVNAVYKMSTGVSVVRNAESLAYSGTFTPGHNGMIHGATFKNIATSTSIVDSNLSTTVLANTSAITNAKIASLPQINFIEKETLPKSENQRALIGKIFHDEDRRLMEMDAQTFFNTINQTILDNESEIKLFGGL